MLYIIFITILFTLGSWAYQEVAVKYRPLSPDEQAQIIEEETNAKVLEMVKNKKFESVAGLVSFEYPNTWNLNELDQFYDEEYDIINSMTLATFDNKDKEVFPENNVRINVTIYDLTDKVLDTPLITCDMKTVICEDILINGQKFKSSESVLNTGVINKQLGADLNDKRVTITFLLSTGNKQGENKEIVNKLINSIQVKK
jgi:hypothetical protein